jgi:fatty acid desaturase
MSTHTEMAPKSTRTRDVTSPDVLSRRDGVFWGAVLLLVGLLWFLNALEVINLGAKFTEIILPFFLMVGGLYLLTMKLLRH